MLGLKSRVFFREHVETPTDADHYWDSTNGTWDWIGNAKSMPNPMGEPNMVDVSGLEDLMEVQEEGRRSAPSISLEIPWLKKDKDAIDALAGKTVDMLYLYGSDGQGSAGALAFYGTVSVAPSDADDGELKLTITASVRVIPRWIEDNYTFTVTESEVTGYPKDITVTKK